MGRPGKPTKSDKRTREEDAQSSSASIEPLTKIGRSGTKVLVVGRCAAGCTGSILDKKTAIACQLCGAITHM